MYMPNGTKLSICIHVLRYGGKAMPSISSALDNTECLKARTLSCVYLFTLFV